MGSAFESSPVASCDTVITARPFNSVTMTIATSALQIALSGVSAKPVGIEPQFQFSRESAWQYGSNTMLVAPG
jgi:hypothetical protein